MKRFNRKPTPIVRDLFEEDIAVTGFAGCGGADLGIVAATGRKTDIAINHDPTAIAVFADNWPETECYRADIFSVDPVKACRGRRVRHLHVSPDCRHFSRAKGDAPVQESVRSLADVVPNWARAVRPDVITLENVPEFQFWGPLGADGKPIKERQGESFKAWCRSLEVLGYVIEHRVLSAHHYGAHTSRKRLYLVARCDGQPIAWPKPTHGPGLKKYRTAAECIDWSIACPSVFARKKPLAAATMRRIAAGIVKFVLGSPKPFIVKVNHQGERSPESIDKPLTTVTAARRGHAVVAPTLVQTSYGERKDQAPRVLDLQKPLGTVVAGGQKHGLVESSLVPFVAGCGGRAAQTPSTSGDAPLGTITTKNDRCLVAPQLAAFRVNTAHGDRDKSGKRRGPGQHSIEQPLGTVTAGGTDHALAGAQLAAFISQFNLGQVGHELNKPRPTITAIDHHALATATVAPREFFEQYPNARHVYPFLISYYGSEADIGQALGEPLRTITTRDRFGLVTLVLDRSGNAIVDIGLRMLEPHELLKAQFGKYARGFRLDKALTKKDQVRLIGNSVVPVVMEAIVRANLGASKPTRRAA